MSKRRLQLVIDGHLGNVAPLGHAVRAVCLGAGLGAAAAAEVELSVVEAVNNSIEHAYRERAGEVRVSLQLGDETIEVRVCDTGQAMPEGTLARASMPQFNPDQLALLPEGGMGLGIVKELMQDLHYESRDGENVLTMSRRTGAMPPPPK